MASLWRCEEVQTIGSRFRLWSTSPSRPAVRPLWVRSTGGRGVGMQNKTANEPHAKRRGRLSNANPQGAPRCGARTRKGTPCGCPAVIGKKRCRMHGGLSTGPRTAAGLARSKQARWKHGGFSAEARQEAAHFRELLRESKELERLSGTLRTAKITAVDRTILIVPN